MINSKLKIEMIIFSFQQMEWLSDKGRKKQSAICNTVLNLFKSKLVFLIYSKVLWRLYSYCLLPSFLHTRRYMIQADWIEWCHQIEMRLNFLEIYSASLQKLFLKGFVILFIFVKLQEFWFFFLLAPSSNFA